MSNTRLVLDPQKILGLRKIKNNVTRISHFIVEGVYPKCPKPESYMFNPKIYGSSSVQRDWNSGPHGSAQSSFQHTHYAVHQLLAKLR